MIMKKMMKNIVLVALCLMLGGFTAYAGNTDRSGEAGAYELLINPWARSSGLHGLNTASISGVESMRVNVGGLVLMDRTQVLLARSIYFQGSDISVNAFGFGQRVGETGVMGISLMSMGFGDIPVTTTDLPEGTGATFSPTFFNLGISYAKDFSNSIKGGATLRIISESIADVSATGMAIDAGILYVAGKDNNVRFGIALRNVGTPMRFSGDGLSFQATEPEDGDYTITSNQRAEKFELPSMLNIGAAYDFLIGEKNKLTIIGNFTSNSFTRDVLGAGIEFNLLERFMLRAGYRYEDDVFSDFEQDGRTNIHQGLSAGFSVNLPLKEDGPRFGLDYGYKLTSPYNGTHVLGLRLDL